MSQDPDSTVNATAMMFKFISYFIKCDGSTFPQVV